MWKLWFCISLNWWKWKITQLRDGCWRYCSINSPDLELNMDIKETKYYKRNRWNFKPREEGKDYENYKTIWRTKLYSNCNNGSWNSWFRWEKCSNDWKKLTQLLQTTSKRNKEKIFRSNFIARIFFFFTCSKAWTGS